MLPIPRHQQFDHAYNAATLKFFKRYEMTNISLSVHKTSLCMAGRSYVGSHSHIIDSIHGFSPNCYQMTLPDFQDVSSSATSNRQTAEQPSLLASLFPRRAGGNISRKFPRKKNAQNITKADHLQNGRENGMP